MSREFNIRMQSEYVYLVSVLKNFKRCSQKKCRKIADLYANAIGKFFSGKDFEEIKKACF